MSDSDSSGMGSGSPGREPELQLEVLVHEERQGERRLVRMKGRDGAYHQINSLMAIPCYGQWVNNRNLNAEAVPDHVTYSDELHRLTMFLLRPDVRITTSGMDCFNLAVRREETKYAGIEAPHGVIYYNKNADLNTFGEIGQWTGVTVRAKKAHIEKKKKDKHGNTTNRIILRKETCYLIRGTRWDSAPIYFTNAEKVVVAVDRAAFERVLGATVTQVITANSVIGVLYSQHRPPTCIGLVPYESIDIMCEDCHESFRDASTPIQRRCYDKDCIQVVQFSSDERKGTTVMYKTDHLLQSVRHIRTVPRRVDMETRYTERVLKVVKAIKGRRTITLQELVEISRTSRAAVALTLARSTELGALFSPTNLCYAPYARGTIEVSEILETRLDPANFVGTTEDGGLVCMNTALPVTVAKGVDGVYHIERSAGAESSDVSLDDWEQEEIYRMG